MYMYMYMYEGVKTYVDLPQVDFPPKSRMSCHPTLSCGASAPDNISYMKTCTCNVCVRCFGAWLYCTALQIPGLPSTQLWIHWLLEILTIDSCWERSLLFRKGSHICMCWALCASFMLCAHSLTMFCYMPFVLLVQVIIFCPRYPCGFPRMQDCQAIHNLGASQTCNSYI